VKKHLPNWRFRIYINPSIAKEISSELVDMGVEVFVMNGDSVGHRGSMWRYLPASEELPFIAIDLDDTFSLQQSKYVKSWLSSDSDFIIFPRIKMFLPIVGKRWGSRRRAIPNIQTLINEYSHSWFGTDEAFLQEVIWPIVREKGYWSPPLNVESFFIYLGMLILITAVVFWCLK